MWMSAVQIYLCGVKHAILGVAAVNISNLWHICALWCFGSLTCVVLRMTQTAAVVERRLLDNAQTLNRM